MSPLSPPPPPPPPAPPLLRRLRLRWALSLVLGLGLLMIMSGAIAEGMESSSSSLLSLSLVLPKAPPLSSSTSASVLRREVESDAARASRTSTTTPSPPPASASLPSPALKTLAEDVRAADTLAADALLPCREPFFFPDQGQDQDQDQDQDQGQVQDQDQDQDQSHVQIQDPDPETQRRDEESPVPRRWFFGGEGARPREGAKLLPEPWRPMDSAAVIATHERLLAGKPWRLSRAEVENFTKADEAFRARRGYAPWSFTGAWGGSDCSRTVHLMLLRKWIGELGICAIPGPIVDCNGPNPEADYFRALAQPGVPVLMYNYKGTNRGDLHHVWDLVYRNASVFIVPQTLEHVQNIHVALRNIHDVVSPGGLVYASIPFINRPHTTPFHFSHWTATGLAVAFESNGFEVLRARGWGNAEYVAKIFSMKVHSWPSCGLLGDDLDSPHNKYAQVAVLARRLPP